jgi:hypothetical protein
MTVKDMHLLERLEQAALSPPQERRLYTLIAAVFKQAIDSRSPKNRPPGKAGLRAEKGYYRLLYLEGDFQEKVNSQGRDQSGAAADDRDFIPVILRRLKDIPELQSEIMAGIEAALQEVTDRAAG